MIPDVKRKEWSDLIMGKSHPKITSFSLQMKINTLATGYKSGKVQLETAVKDLHSLCVKYEKIYQDDLNKIFK